MTGVRTCRLFGRCRYDKYGYPRAPASAVPVPGTEVAAAEEEEEDGEVGIVGSGPLTGPATLLEVHESGWVAPASPSKAIAAVPDFARSAVTFVIDLAAKPAATMSDIPVTSARLADLRHT
jgi:hypothetical protein